MRKKFLVAVGAAIVTAAVSVFVYVNNEKDSMDDLFFANVDALSKEEIDPDGYVSCFMNVYDSGAPGYYLKVRECMNCTIDTAEKVSGSNTCMK
ncbi:MAG: hypothetical protein NC308_01825 [Clostridium sp.]|nr:hypothetical protein [Bacteroides sp.]MCM1197606.1 hypothetical protein [Clostridium sp.]